LHYVDIVNAAQSVSKELTLCQYAWAGFATAILLPFSDRLDAISKPVQ